MKYYGIEPEVAGGWGKNTVFDRIPGKGTFVHKLHYVFDGWLGDELLESSACYIVTERLAHEIERAQLTGAQFHDVEISTSGEYDDFQELHPDRQLPTFVWLKVEGSAGHDDFGIAPDLRLVVSEHVLDLLKAVGISNALITPFESD